MKIGDLIVKLRAYGEDYEQYELMSADSFVLNFETPTGDELRIFTNVPVPEKKGLFVKGKK